MSFPHSGPRLAAAQPANRRRRADARVAALLLSGVALALTAGCESTRPPAVLSDDGASPPNPDADPDADADAGDVPVSEPDAPPDTPASLDVVGTRGPQPPTPCAPDGRGRWCRHGRAAHACSAESWPAVCRDGYWVCEGHGPYSFGIAEDKCGPDPASALTDAGPIDDPDAASACNGPRVSTLSGVKLLFHSDEPCSYTRDQVASGIAFEYQLIVEADVPELHQPRGSVCKGPSPDNGLITSFDIAGGTQRYCFCDNGFGCVPRIDTYETTARKGVYDGKIVWYGDNWTGPSDTFVQYGPPFPPGTYTLTVRIAGTRGAGADAAQDPFEVSAQRHITILP